ncbi:MAG: ATP-dependent Clp protease proteolytic subunit [Planctomycetota bacterium]
MAKTKKKRGEEEQPPVELAIVGEIFDEAESEFVKDLLSIPAGEEFTLYLDSAGGSVYAALTIAGMIRSRKHKVTAIVLGECSSSAILIFAACQRRLVSPRSVFLFHRVKWRSEKDVRSEEAVNWAGHFQWLEEEIDAYQAALFGLAEDRFAAWIKEGRFVLGPQLVELGIAEFIDV